MTAGLLLVLVATSCTSSGNDAASTSRGECDTSGRLVAMAGKELVADRIVEVTLCPFAVRRLYQGSSISSISAAGPHIVGSGMVTPGQGDQVFRLVGGRLDSLPGLGLANAFLPVVNRDGRIGFTLGTQAEGNQSVQLLQSADDPTPEPVMEIRDLSRTLKWDGDRLLLLHVPGVVAEPPRGTEVDAAIATVWPPEARTTRAVRLPWPAGFVVGRAGRIGIMQGVSRTDPRGWVVDGAGTRTPLPAGWYPLAFEPDGDRLAVASSDGAKVGIASPPAYDEVRVLGSSSEGRVWYGDWTR